MSHFSAYLLLCASPQGGPTDFDRQIHEANRALKVLGVIAPLAPIVGPGSDAKLTNLSYGHSTAFVDPRRVLIRFFSNEELRRKIQQRPSGQSVIKRSDAKWAEMGLEIAKKLWPTAKLTLKKATRSPEEARNPITGQGSVRSNMINLEYRGIVGTWRVRADVVFDQVTGKITMVRMGDEPKPR